MPEPTDVVADAMSYAEAGDLRAVREFVANRAAAAGLPPERVDLLTLAISELATNTLQHTGGGGRVSLWVDGGQLVCDVVDGGSLRSFGRAMPASDALRGRGLAIVERVCDAVDVATVADGTLVRVRLGL
jgi:anti-sigma regulatory factor (Ser/Thr protein kinase)